MEKKSLTFALAMFFAICILPVVSLADVTNEWSSRSFIVEDSSTSELYPSNNHGSGSAIHVWSYTSPYGINDDRRGYYGIDFSSLTYSAITEANIRLYVNADFGNTTSGVVVLELYYCNDMFNESNITWSNQDAEVTNCSLFLNNTAWAGKSYPTDYMDFNITDIVLNESLEDKKFTLKLKMNPENPVFGTNARGSFASKEAECQYPFQPRLFIEGTGLVNPVSNPYSPPDESANDYWEYATSISYDGYWESSHCYSVLYDGNWGTYAYSILNYPAYYYGNYTKPLDSVRVGSQWQIKYLSSTVNLTIPNVCWLQDPLQFKVESCRSCGGGTWSCWDGYAWYSLASTDYRLYEEGVFWNRTGIIPTTTTTVLGSNITYQECYDENTLKTVIARELCDDSGCEIISLAEFTHCEHGCVENQCRQSPIIQIIFVILAICVIGIVIWWFLT